MFQLLLLLFVAADFGNSYFAMAMTSAWLFSLFAYTRIGGTRGFAVDSDLTKSVVFYFLPSATRT